MLFNAETLEQIASGRVTVAFRCWRRPTVKTGGTLHTPIGLLAIDKVESISRSDVRLHDARKAGFASVEDVCRECGRRSGARLYRIKFHLVGDDPRIALRKQWRLSAADADALVLRLKRLDARSACGPWTRAVLLAIRDHPDTRSAQLAQLTGFEKEWLKTNVRKLKNLGLTESLEVGYQIAPRGESLLARWEAQ